MEEEKQTLVCVTGQKTCERLIAEGDRLAKKLGTGLSVVHVARQGAGLLDGDIAEAEALEYLFQVSSEHGAGMSVIRSNEVVPTLVHHARKIKAVVMVLGSSRNARQDVTVEMKKHMPDMEFEIVYTEE